MNMDIIQHKTEIRSLPKERFGFVWETKKLFNLFHVSLLNIKLHFIQNSCLELSNSVLVLSQHSTWVNKILFKGCLF